MRILEVFMKIDIVTLFPEMFRDVFGVSMMKIAQGKGLVEIKVHDLREYTVDKHRTADDKPYGGGVGMVMKVEPVDKAINALKNSADSKVKQLTVLLTPQGGQFSQDQAKSFLRYEHIILIAGHYEGFDERIRLLVDLEVSIGDYILTCGEIPAMVVTDAVVRLLPGVLGDEACLIDESFENNILEYPQYTRPAEYKNMRVPDVLLCGDPKKIDAWKQKQALERTAERRPDLLRE